MDELDKPIHRNCTEKDGIVTTLVYSFIAKVNDIYGLSLPVQPTQYFDTIDPHAELME